MLIQAQIVPRHYVMNPVHYLRDDTHDAIMLCYTCGYYERVHGMQLAADLFFKARRHVH